METMHSIQASTVQFDLKCYNVNTLSFSQNIRSTLLVRSCIHVSSHKCGKLVYMLVEVAIFTRVKAKLDDRVVGTLG